MHRSESANRSQTRKNLISAALDFVASISHMHGVERVALVGSICTTKPEPKDVDVLVTIAPSVDMKRLATLGRKLKGTTQRINCGADIFLAEPNDQYLGRICHWKVCRRGERMSCKAMNCGRVPYLYDDTHCITLDRELILNPPIVVFPQVIIRTKLPADLVDELRIRLGERATGL